MNNKYIKILFVMIFLKIPMVSHAKLAFKCLGQNQSFSVFSETDEQGLKYTKVKLGGKKLNHIFFADKQEESRKAKFYRIDYFIKIVLEEKNENSKQKINSTKILMDPIKGKPNRRIATVSTESGKSLIRPGKYQCQAPN